MRKLKSGKNQKFYQFDRQYGFWGIPNISRNIFYPEYNKNVFVRHDNFGNRSTTSFENIETKANLAVLFLGGSHTWGAGVENDETYASLVAKNTGFPCLNYGHCSFGLDQMILVLLKQLGELSVRTVVLELHPWVIHRVLRKAALGFPKPYFTLQSNELKLNQVNWISTIPAFRKLLSEYSNFEKEYNEYLSGIDLRRTERGKQSDPLFNIWSQGYYTDLYVIIRKLLLVARDECLRRGIDLLVLLGPTKQELEYRESKYKLNNPSLPRRRLKAILEDENISYFDLAPDFKKLHHEQDTGLFSDGHINNLGHNIFADKITEYVR